MQGWFGPQDGPLDEWIRKHSPHKDEAEREASRSWIDYYVGLNLGLRQDHSACSIVQLREGLDGKQHYYVIHLNRFPLNTPYAKIAKALRKVDTSLKINAEGKGKEASIMYAIDATGVGEGISEIISRELPEVDLYKVYLTGGIAPNFIHEHREVHLPKSQMVSTLVALFDDNTIFLSKRSKEIDAMIEELQHFQIKVSDNGHDSFAAATLHHDDLICSLGIATYLASQWGTRVIQFW